MKAENEDLLRLVNKMVDYQDPLACLKQLAVERGCLHYEGTFDPPSFIPSDLYELTNEQLGVALCLPHFGRSPNNIRIAAEVISAKAVSAQALAFLAQKERCVREIAYIASCGKKVEPQHPFWTELLAALPDEKEKPPLMPMPHWTRFAILTGIDRHGK